MKEKLRLIVIGIVAATLVGCATTPLQDVRNFGKASTSFATDAGKGFTILTDSMAEYDLSHAAADPSSPLLPETFKGSDEEKTIREAVPKLKAILSNVAEYGQALQTLAEADFKKSIDDSATELNSSLEGLRTSFEKDTGSKLAITSTDIQILSTAVEGIGVVVAEAKRKHAIKLIVTKTDPAIQQVSQRMAVRFKRDIGPAVETYFTATLGPMYKDFYENWKEKTYPERRDREEQIRKQEMVNQGIQPLFDQLSKASTQMGQAHAALASAVQKDNFTTADFHARVVALVDYTKSVKQFYDSLDKETKK